MKVGILSGRPKDGTILPKEERQVWNELLRVLKQEMTSPLFQHSELLIPIYSKFDLQVLRYAEDMGYATQYYVPSMDWGLSKLPKHQRELIRRVNAPRVILPPPTNRLVRLIQDSDIVYLLPETEGLETYIPYLQHKPVITFPINHMRFTTEAQADSLLDNVQSPVTDTTIDNIIHSLYTK